jgi:hypothetical protein
VDTRSAEQWARSTFEDAPAALLALILAGWTAGLGLKLGPRPSPDHVLGWKITKRTPQLVLFSVRARMIGHAQFVLQTESSRVLLTNFVRYETPWARPLWATVQPLHHLIIPYLLTHAASHPAPTLS